MKRSLTLRAALLAVGLAGCIALPAAAFAQEMSGFYVRGDVGASISAPTSGDIFHGNGFGQTFGTGFMFDAGMGARVGNFSGMGLRFDATVGYRPGREGFHSAPNTVNPSNTTILSTTTKVDTLTVLGNGYIDIPIDSKITPYVGAGAGVASNRLHTLNYFFNTAAGGSEPGQTQSNFAWQLMGGLSFPVSDSVTADVAYHYLDTGAVRSTGLVTLANGVSSSQPAVQSNLHAHEVTAGVRLTF